MRPAGGRLVAGGSEHEFSGVSIDTRTIASNELFIAIRGERFDAVTFVSAALERGAGGVVVPRGWQAGQAETAAAVIEVDDTTAALQSLGHAVRRESGTKVVAITGSAGKTTTKEVTWELLATRLRVVRNRGNLNNHIGLPLSLIELRQRPEVAVVELGMNHAGEISTLVKMATPDVRVWTNVGDAHLGFFPSVDAIAEAKAEIFEGADASTLLVANADDERIAARLPKFAGRISTFGIDRPADIRAVGVVDRGTEGTTARLTTPSGAVDLEVPLIGRGNLMNVLAAIAVAIEFAIPLDVIADHVSKLRPASHRGDVVRLAMGAVVVDDSYNANPTATRGALEVLAHSNVAGRGRRVAVLGEMLELGDRSKALHEEVGRTAAGTVDLLFTIGGPSAAAMSAAAVSAGMASAAVQHFSTSDEAAVVLAATIAPGDLVLVKGSRGVKTDRVVERLKAERG
ncbi:MAG TPA: UDP-N-acetylmuramoyl-tripeptide--D-alanyl-D-alanine ligase [Vicinamibacterales bacterium]